MQPPLKNKTYIDSVLQKNANLDFVKRLYEKNTPSIQIEGEPGRSTHLMESSDGMVYPRVIRNEKGQLVHLGDAARDYAIRNRAYIQFPTDEDAQWFAENYKKGTNVLSGFKPKVKIRIKK